MKTFYVGQTVYCARFVGDLKIVWVVDKKNKLTKTNNESEIKYLICSTKEDKTVQINLDEVILPEEM